MTQTHERFENTSLVEAWLKEPTRLEPVDENRVAAIVHHTPQARRWPPQVDFGRFAPMLNATKFAAASVVLALTGGLLFNVLPTRPAPAELIPAAETATASATAETTIEVATEPPAVTDSDMPIITLPDELPEGVDSGTIDTPAGPARWVRIADRESVPLPWISDVMPWGDGIAAFAGHYLTMASTEDGVNWEPIGLPAAEISLIDAAYVAVSPESGRVWTSKGAGDEWHELDTSAVALAFDNGWKKRGWSATVPAHVDGRTVFGIGYGYELPRPKLGIPKEGWTQHMKRLSRDRYALCGGGTCKDGGNVATVKLRFKEVGRGLKVIDDKTGKRLGVIDGATLDELYEGDGAVDHRAFAIEGDAVVPIDSPWPKRLPSTPAFRGGQPTESRPPAGVPEGAVPRWSGSAWLAASQAGRDDPAAWWSHLGGEWVSLEPLGLGLCDGCGSVAGLEGVSIFDVGDRGVWVLMHPTEME